MAKRGGCADRGWPDSVHERLGVTKSAGLSKKGSHSGALLSSCKGLRCLIRTMVPGLHVHPGWFRGWR